MGIETAFPLLYTVLVKGGLLSLEALGDLLCYKPRARFGIPLGDDFSLWDLEAEHPIDPREFLSRGKATPFAGRRVYGRCKGTVHGGKLVYFEE